MFIVSVTDDFSTKWFNDRSELHREDGPAIVWSCGDKHWYKNGQLHREDGPAVEYNNGQREYWIDGLEVEEWWVMGKNNFSKLETNWLKEGF
jgi:hypothetical protein